MDTKTKKQRPSTAPRETGNDVELDRYLAENHDEIEAKLDEAREEIAAGRAAPLEPLPDLLRAARKRRHPKSAH